jgi:hypothetical protein
VPIESPSFLQLVLPTVAKEDFDIFDKAQRDRAFRDEFFGIVTSGATDLAINGVMSKVTGAATKAAMTKVRGTSRIVTEKDMQENPSIGEYWEVSK